jgi:hypothetical protein
VAASAQALDEGAMIQPLRRAHFRIWLVLAVVLYALFLAGLIVRRSTTPLNPNVHWEKLQ